MQGKYSPVLKGLVAPTITDCFQKYAQHVVSLGLFLKATLPLLSFFLPFLYWGLFCFFAMCVYVYLLAKTNLHFLKDGTLELLSPAAKTQQYCHFKIYVDLVINIKAKRRQLWPSIRCSDRDCLARHLCWFTFLAPDKVYRCRCFVNEDDAIHCSFNIFLYTVLLGAGWCQVPCPLLIYYCVPHVKDSMIIGNLVVLLFVH